MKNNKPTTITYTTAEPAYDWFGTKDLGVVGKTVGSCPKNVRKVEGPADRVEQQRDRYASGLHMAVDQAEFEKRVGFKLIEVVS